MASDSTDLRLVLLEFLLLLLTILFDLFLRLGAGVLYALRSVYGSLSTW